MICVASVLDPAALIFTGMPVSLVNWSAISFTASFVLAAAISITAGGASAAEAVDVTHNGVKRIARNARKPKAFDFIVSIADPHCAMNGQCYPNRDIHENTTQKK